MARDDFERLEALFHQARELAPGERDAFLERACGETTAQIVRELLQADAAPFLREPIVGAPRSPRLLPENTRIGDYLILEHLGSGGMGDVYRAKNIRLGRDAAIKIGARGLLTEGRHAARLSHPNICAVFDVVEHDGRACLIMELVRGLTLEQRLQGGALPFPAAQRYATEIADALAHAHDGGVIHGDLKPANVMIDTHGQVKVLDFGVARSMPGHATGDTTTSSHLTAPVGTLRYMPPEALRGEGADSRGDLWSLGVVLYQMVAGVPPFNGQTPFELSSSILRDAPPPLDPDVPAPLARVIRKCLEKDAAKRYQSARDARADLAIPSPPVTIRWRSAAAVVLAALLAVAGWFALPRGTTPSERVSIAVLPLESLSGGGDEYFADGVTEVLIGDLAQVRAIRVISRQSAARYRGSATPLPEIARALGVDYLVKGTVTRDGGQVRVTAQLVDPFTDEHLWASTVTRPVEDLLTVQNEVARAIARHVAVTIRPEEERRFAESRAVKADVLEAYLRGRALWRSRSEGNLKEAIQAFETAIKLDPQHAQSYAGLADTYAVLASLGIVPAREGYPPARTAALAAIRLDPYLAEPYASLGRVKFSFEWDGRAAEEAFARALDLNPGYDTAHQWYAVFLATRRRMEEALRQARLAEQGNPFSPIVHWNVARTYFFDGRDAEALEATRRALALVPDFEMAHLLAARIHAHGRRFDAAADALARIPKDKWRSEVAAVAAYLAARRGDRATAVATLKRLESETASQYVPVYHLAKVAAALGDVNQAFRYLERAADEQNAQLVFVNVDPELAVLRPDPRFKPLAQRVGVWTDR